MRALRFTSLAELTAWAQRRAPRSTPARLDHVPSPEDVLGILLTDAGIPFTRQFPFHPRRHYRADFFIAPNLLVECDGGTFLKGPSGHQGKGYEDDRERDAEALALGYIVLRCTPRQIANMKALTWIQRLLAAQEIPRV